MAKNLSKFKFLFGYSLTRRVKTKSFLISNIILAIVILCLTNIGSIISFFGGDFSETQTVYVYDQTEKSAGQVLEACFEGNENFEIKIQDTDFVLEEKDTYLEDASILVVLKLDNGLVAAECFADDISMTNETILTQMITTTRTSVWMNDHAELAETLAELNTPMDIDWKLSTEDSSSVASMLSMGIGLIVLVPVMMLTVFLVQFVGMDIVEEKSSRAIEVIISNVPSGQHFAAKITSGITFIVIQTLLLTLYGFIGLGISLLTNSVDLSSASTISSGIASAVGIDSGIISEILSRVPSMLFVLLIFIVAGFIMYSVIIAVLSAMTTTMEDYQSFQTPLVLVLLAGFYIALFGVQMEGSLFVKIAGYIPLFSPMIAPILFISGDFAIVDVIISFVLLVGFDALIIRFGIPLYKVSILSYSQDPFMKRVKKLIKKSKYSE